jgi:hypothetical protein
VLEDRKSFGLISDACNAAVNDSAICALSNHFAVCCRLKPVAEPLTQKLSGVLFLPRLTHWNHWWDKTRNLLV